MTIISSVYLFNLSSIPPHSSCKSLCSIKFMPIAVQPSPSHPHWNLLLTCRLPLFEWSFPGGSDGKESACKAGDLGSIPGSGRSPGEEYGYPLQYSCLENSIEEKLVGLQSIQSMESQRVRHSWVTNTFTYLYTIKCWKSEDSHITLILHCPNSVLEVLCICCQIYVKQ